MSRIELDYYDRFRVEKLRADLTTQQAQQVGTVDEYALCRRIGHVEAIAEALLRVIDGPVVDGE